MRNRPSAWILVCLLPALAAWGQSGTATPDPQDYRVITSVPRAEFDRWLKDEIRQSGGDFDNERYDFVLGFSTGHYGSDPVHAIAMRRLAFSLLNNSFAAGDRVTPLGWEMKLWHRGKAAALTSDPKTRAAFVNEVPYSTAAESRGGHDTERAMFESLTKTVSAERPNSTVILLLTNTNQSQGPTGVRVPLFGSNNPQLRDAIRSKQYRSPVRRSFRAESRTGPLTIDVTGLFPKELKTLPGVAAGPRYPTFPPDTWQPAADRPGAGEALPNPTASAASATPAPAPNAPSPAPVVPTAPAAEEKKGLPWWWWIPLLLAAIIIFLVIRGSRKPAAKKEEPRRGRPVPGSLTMVLGAAPNETRVPLRGLTTASAWALHQVEGQAPALTPEEEKPEGVRLASVSIDEKGKLQVKAEGDTTFLELKGINVAACTSRQLVVATGERLVCRMASVRLPAALRLEWIYAKEGQG